MPGNFSSYQTSLAHTQVRDTSFCPSFPDSNEHVTLLEDAGTLGVPFTQPDQGEDGVEEWVEWVDWGAVEAAPAGAAGSGA